MNYTLKSTIFFPSEVNTFKYAVHYVVYLISFEVYLLQVQYLVAKLISSIHTYLKSS
jgi:hypothetical protein